MRQMTKLQELMFFLEQLDVDADWQEMMWQTQREIERDQNEFVNIQWMEQNYG